jgi:lipoate---protein ligase
MLWEIIDTGFGTAEENMLQDEELLKNLQASSLPKVHFYEWENKSVTYGLLTDPKEFLDLRALNIEEIDLAKRPTGGGIIFHLWDFAFSVLIPSEHPLFSKNTLENYALINRSVLGCVEDFLEGAQAELTGSDAVTVHAHCERFCMAKPTRYDVMVQGKKIAGAAQRKTRQGFLHQGSISLVFPDEPLLQRVLYPDTGVIESMKKMTYPLLGEGDHGDDEIAEVKELLKKKLLTQLRNL